MTSEHLRIDAEVELSQPAMVLGFSGWMNGGNVSLGTLECLRQELSAVRLGEIRPEGFYIYSFPGSMEVSAMFRPHTKIEEGVITSFHPPTSSFHVSPSHDVILFEGREPNFQWTRFAGCFLDLAERYSVRRIFFIGSVAGVVPHTREPRIFTSVSRPEMRPELSEYGLRLSGYEGPASFITYLTTECSRRGVEMATLVAEIPAYIQGANPRGIETAVRTLSALLELDAGFEELRKVSDVFERKVNEVVDERPDLHQLVEKLEGDYDNEVFDTQMGDLKQWLTQQGIRLD